MVATQMSYEDVMAQLEAWGLANTRRLYERQGAGAGANMYGVSLGQLRGLAKQLKTDHPLALQLWASGNIDAMMLASMLMAGDRLSEGEIDAMLRPLSYHRLVCLSTTLSRKAHLQTP